MTSAVSFDTGTFKFEERSNGAMGKCQSRSCRNNLAVAFSQRLFSRFVLIVAFNTNSSTITMFQNTRNVDARGSTFNAISVTNPGAMQR
jgi:hypothetical protein